MISHPARRVVRGACPHDCPDTCATLTTVEGDRAVTFEADPDHPFTQRLVHMDVAGVRLWNRMGASGLERSICGAAAESAVRHTLGARFSPAPADVLASRLVVIWGHNPVSTSPHFMPFLQDAIRGGTKLVVIDPRRTATARPTTRPSGWPRSPASTPLRSSISPAHGRRRARRS